MKQYWSTVPGILYIDVPESVLDKEVTVLAVLLDGPIELYRKEGEVIEANWKKQLFLILFKTITIDKNPCDKIS